MRKIFLAIRIPVDPMAEAVVNELQRNFNFMNVRWVEPQYLHMTIKYFGPTSEKRIKKIVELLNIHLQNHGSFELSINKLGMFGSRGAPKLLWLGIKEEQQLKDLAKKIQTKLDTLGLYADRQNFVPHITLGRIVKTNSNTFFQKQMAKFKSIEMPSIDISDIVLLESIISDQGVDYKQIEIFDLIKSV